MEAWSGEIARPRPRSTTGGCADCHGMTAVLYLAGAGRSGSTLLERLLGTASGVTAAGELRWLWTRGFAENHLCSCGAAFRECPFWIQVVEAAFGSVEAVDPAAMQVAAREVDRIRYIPYNAWPRLAPRRFADRHAEYAAVVSRVYSALSAVSGSDLIVDSSKELPYVFLLRSVRDLDVFVVHLVRDSRAVAFSWQRVRRRPEITSEIRYMPRYGVRKTSRDWMEKNMLSELYERLDGGLVRVRYEDMAASPETTVNRILDVAARSLGIAPLGRYQDRSDIQQHTISGNPVRFAETVPPVRLDDEWQTAMPTRDRIQVSLLTAPLLVRYGYQVAVR
jgi:hypothetical protein